jgi:sigma-B regulation protein RsbU (phosphoserine phosphatase)
MHPIVVSAVHALRPQIVERRARLQAAATSVSAEYLNDLLAEIDAALQRIDAGTYGLCETCHDAIEPDRLQADPLTRFWLDHLSPSELQDHQRDLELAMQIQSELLPRGSIALEHWDAQYRYEPAGPVGGDYCELSRLAEDNSLFFAVGDIAGKGVAASLLMTHLSAIVRSLMSLRLPLAELVSRANRLLCESTMASHYATLVCGRVSGNDVELCNAGHCPPLLLRGGEIQRFDSAGIPLGLFCNADFPVLRAALTDGESLILYSDGITEARDPHGNEFGEERLTRSLRDRFDASAGVIAQTVMEGVKAFRNGARPADDTTLLVLRRVG